jgi:pilus assembly protein CpaB
MRINNVIILIVAVVLGGLAAFLARNWMVSHAQPIQQANKGMIVVAAAPVAFGAQLTAANLNEIPWNAADLPEGAFATVQDLVKDGRRLALASIARNEPILRGKITAPGQRATLSTILDPGKRAVTVRVDDLRGVAGFIQPGDRVDVVLIRTQAETKASEGYSDVILQSAKVLAIDQLTGERTEQATIAKAVTLELSAEEAQKILLATNIGRLSLILRQPDEANGDPARRVTERDLSTAPVVVDPKPVVVDPKPVAHAPPSRTRHITIWHGMNPQDYERPADLVRN